MPGKIWEAKWRQKSAPSRQMEWPAQTTSPSKEEVEQQEQEEKMADTELPKPEIIEVGTDASYLARHA